MFIDLKKRSEESELLDAEGIPEKELWLNLKELDTINQLLGGHHATLLGMKQLMKDKDRTYRIIDFGCGGGDTLREIVLWAIKKGFKVELTGLDLLPAAITYAKQSCKDFPEIEFICMDYHDFVPEQKYDISTCSLFCHHLYDADLDSLLKKMINTAQLGIVINDLHRNWFAYYSISLLTRLLSKSHLVKNDARLSVAKGFRMAEWRAMLNELKIDTYSLKWIWAFRHLIVIPTK